MFLVTRNRLHLIVGIVNITVHRSTYASCFSSHAPNLESRAEQMLSRDSIHSASDYGMKREEKKSRSTTAQLAPYLSHSIRLCPLGLHSSQECVRSKPFEPSSCSGAQRNTSTKKKQKEFWDILSSSSATELPSRSPHQTSLPRFGAKAIAWFFVARRTRVQVALFDISVDAKRFMPFTFTCMASFYNSYRWYGLTPPTNCSPLPFASTQSLRCSPHPKPEPYKSKVTLFVAPSIML